jgi:YD repeat-containing protein
LVRWQRYRVEHDALNRLIHAETADNTWGETYQYDGFGNLTAKTPTKGSAPAWSATYNAATNWQVGVQYDADGNPPVGTFDVENRLVSEIDPSTGDTVSFLYDPWGKRVGRQDQTERTYQYTLYGVTGQRLAVLGCTSNGQQMFCATANSNVYFKGRLLMRAVGGYLSADRVGSMGADSTGYQYFPYGEEQWSPPTPTGVERFATYYRDFVGQDYLTSGITTASGAGF